MLSVKMDCIIHVVDLKLSLVKNVIGHEVILCNVMLEHQEGLCLLVESY